MSFCSASGNRIEIRWIINEKIGLGVEDRQRLFANRLWLIAVKGAPKVGCYGVPVDVAVGCLCLLLLLKFMYRLGKLLKVLLVVIQGH